MKILTVFVLAILLLTQLYLPAGAALFYIGGIVIDSISATIDINHAASVEIEYVLVNSGDDAESVSLTHAAPEATARLDGTLLSNPVEFEPDEKKTLTVSYSIDLQAGDSKSMTFDPVLLIDNMAYPEKIQSIDIELVLPAGIERLTYSNLTHNEIEIRDGRTTYIWSKSGMFASPLYVSWTALDVDLVATKTTRPATVSTAGEIIEVEVTVTNQGDTQVKNIMLSDDFHPGVFEAVSPLEEFELLQPELSDPQLYWTKEIEGLAPDESKTFDYSVKIKHLSFENRLDAVVVSVGGTPVCVSNDVVIYSEIEGRYAVETAESEFPTAVLVIGLILAAIFVWAMLSIRRKKRR